MTDLDHYDDAISPQTPVRTFVRDPIPCQTCGGCGHLLIVTQFSVDVMDEPCPACLGTKVELPALLRRQAL